MSELVPGAAAWTWFFKAFVGQANGLVSRYGSPIYLTGGALWQSDPYDIDIRVMMKESDLERFFGPNSGPTGYFDEHWMSRRSWRKLREELKRSRRLSRMTPYWDPGGRHFAIDFQIQDEGTFARYEKLGYWKLRLDTATDDFFEAGNGAG